MEERRPPVDPLVRLRQLWSWLPAFRAVAESEHLPTAARRLGVSPSALSRSISLLEAELGRPLFARTGRNLVLTPEGVSLLDALRTSMRGLHSAVSTLAGDAVVGPFGVGVTGAAALVHVLPAVEAFASEHPLAEPDLRTVTPAQAIEGLRAGRFDVAFHSAPLADRMLRSERLGALTNGVYCGPRSPLHGREGVGAHALGSSTFVAPHDGAAGPADGWPSEVPRTVSFRADAMQTAVEVVRGSARVAVFPDLLARAYADLWRVPVDLVAPTSVYAVLRAPVGPPGRAEALVERVRAQFGTG